MLKAVSRAPWLPTTSRTASAPRPSVAAMMADCSPPGARAVAPCLIANSRRAGVGSTAKTLEKSVCAEVMAQSPT